MMGDLKHVLRTDAHADFTAFAKLLINIYRHGKFLTFHFHTIKDRMVSTISTGFFTT